MAPLSLGRFHMHRDSAIYYSGDGGWEADNEAMAGAFARCLLAGMDIPRSLPGAVAKQAEIMTAATDPARLWQRLASAQSADSPLRAVLLANLSQALTDRFARTGDPASLEAATAVGQEAIAEAADDDPGFPAMHFLLGSLLLSRFERSSRREDLDGAASSFQRALDASADNDPNRARYLSAYGSCLRARFELSGDPTDLDAAVSACQRAVATADDATRPSWLPALANVLVRRFDEHGRAADLEAALSAFRQGADLDGASRSSGRRRGSLMQAPPMADPRSTSLVPPCSSGTSGKTTLPTLPMPSHPCGRLSTHP